MREAGRGEIHRADFRHTALQHEVPYVGANDERQHHHQRFDPELSFTGHRQKIGDENGLQKSPAKVYTGRKPAKRPTGVSIPAIPLDRTLSMLEHRLNRCNILASIWAPSRS